MEEKKELLTFRTECYWNLIITSTYHILIYAFIQWRTAFQQLEYLRILNLFEFHVRFVLQILVTLVLRFDDVFDVGPSCYATVTALGICSDFPPSII